MFEKELTEYMVRVDKEIKLFMDGRIDEVKDSHPFLSECYSFLRDYILNGGKRLRPVACMKSFEAVTGKEDNKIMLPAIAFELFHTSSLVHDDIMDEDDLRRGKASMHKILKEWFLSRFSEREYKGLLFSKDSDRFSTSVAIIQGNMLYSLGQYCLLNSDFGAKEINGAVRVCDDAYRKVNEGQALDVLGEVKRDISEEDYLMMVRLKTAKLFGASVEAGSIFANANESQRKSLINFANLSGITFQICDDLIDLSKEARKGNTFGSDIRKGKKTLVLIKALKNSGEEQRKRIFSVVGNENATREEINEVVDIFDNVGAIDYAKNVAHEYLLKSKESLRKAEPRLSKGGVGFFDGFADFMINRSR